jgi:spore maturation protein CgeB
LYAGSLWPGSTCVPRLKGLQSLGLEVSVLDTSGWADSRWRLASSWVQRTFLGPSAWRMNAALLRAAQAGVDVVWIDKGTWVYPATLRRLRRRARCLVHYNTDDIYAPRQHFWLHRRSLRLYDVHLTTNRYNVNELRQRGHRALRAGMGHDQDIERLAAGGGEAAPHRLVFVGHWQPHTEEHLAALRERGLPIEVWGHNWRKAQHEYFREAQPLAYAGYVRLVARAEIALCFLSHANRNESTGRSFEIPALGVFMLGERTAEHDYLYGDGVGAAFFSSPAELVDRACYYLERPAERQRLAAAGQARSRALGLSWGDHMRREWPIAARWLADGGASLRPEDDAPFWEGYRAGATA